MALNSDIEKFKLWLESGITESGLKLKSPGEQDAQGYSYHLEIPKVFFSRYPNLESPISNLPSVLVDVSSINFSEDSYSINFSLTLGAWSSGLHSRDIFLRDNETGTYSNPETETFDKNETVDADIYTFIDVVVRILRLKGREIGIKNEDISVNLISDEELGQAGIRFAKIECEVEFPCAPQNVKVCDSIEGLL